MYGTRDAAQNWELEYTEMMQGAGLRQGSYSACVIYHEQKNVRVVAHGDDFTVLGPSKSLDWFRGVVQQRMEVKFKGRLERGKPGAVRILNRIVTVTENGLEYEADHRHAGILMRDMGIDESSKGVVTPGVSVAEGGQTGEILVGGERVCFEEWRPEEITWDKIGWTCSSPPRRSVDSCQSQRNKTGEVRRD